MMSGTVRLMKSSSISMRLRFIGFANTSSTNVAFVSLPASSRANAAMRRLQILIGEQGEEGDVECRAPRRPAGKPAILDIADADARRDVRRRRAIDDHLGAAMVHVVFGRNDGKARRVEPDLKVLRGRARQRAQVQEGRSRRGDRDARGALLQLGHALLAQRARDADGIRPGLRDGAALDAGDGAALQAAFEGEQRDRAAVLFERDRQRGESSAGRFDDDVERAGLADDALGPFDA